MPLGDALYESGTHLSHVYFPTTSIVSLLYVMEDGSSAEIAVVGNEGIVGVSLFMGGETTPSRGIVQSAGHAFRLSGQESQAGVHACCGAAAGSAALHASAVDADGADRRLQSTSLRRSATVPLAAAQLRSPAVQRAGHDARADRQHARRAARGRDRSGGQAAEGRADSLQPRAYQRDATGPASKRASCECYAVVKKEFDRLLPQDG